MIASSEGIDLARAKTTLPLLPPLLRTIVRMPLGARFELVAAHDRSTSGRRSRSARIRTFRVDYAAKRFGSSLTV